MLEFCKWLMIQEDAGPLGPAGATNYQNNKNYFSRGVKSKYVAQDDDGESDPDIQKKQETSPEKLFGMMKKKCKKCKKCKK